MRRIDAFPYAGEADMLECRLTELGDLIDAFVIVEGDVTHGGCTPKPYHYLEQRDRFAAWADQIVYVQATDLPTEPGDAWGRDGSHLTLINEGSAAPSPLVVLLPTRLWSWLGAFLVPASASAAFSPSAGRGNVRLLTNPLLP